MPWSQVARPGCLPNCFEFNNYSPHKVHTLRTSARERSLVEQDSPQGGAARVTVSPTCWDRTRGSLERKTGVPLQRYSHQILSGSNHQLHNRPNISPSSADSFRCPHLPIVQQGPGVLIPGQATSKSCWCQKGTSTCRRPAWDSTLSRNQYRGGPSTIAPANPGLLSLTLSRSAQSANAHPRHGCFLICRSSTPATCSVLDDTPLRESAASLDSFALSSVNSEAVNHLGISSGTTGISCRGFDFLQPPVPNCKQLRLPTPNFQQLQAPTGSFQALLKLLSDRLCVSTSASSGNASSGHQTEANCVRDIKTASPEQPLVFGSTSHSGLSQPPLGLELPFSIACGQPLFISTSTSDLKHREEHTESLPEAKLLQSHQPHARVTTGRPLWNHDNEQRSRVHHQPPSSGRRSSQIHSQIRAQSFEGETAGSDHHQAPGLLLQPPSSGRRNSQIRSQSFEGGSARVADPQRAAQRGLLLRSKARSHSVRPGRQLTRATQSTKESAAGSSPLLRGETEAESQLRSCQTASLQSILSPVKASSGVEQPEGSAGEKGRASGADEHGVRVPEGRPFLPSESKGEVVFVGRERRPRVVPPVKPVRAPRNPQLQYGMRIFALSDLHSDYKDNMEWVQSLSLSDFREDAVIVAGDVADSLEVFTETMRRMKKSFQHVFFVPGNHDLWVRRDDDPSDSLAKLERLETRCAELGVETRPKNLGGVWVVPIMSWHHQSFDKELDITTHKIPTPEKMSMDYRHARWPSAPGARLDPSTDDVALHFDRLNEAPGFREGAEAAAAASDPIVSFSHFLPRLELCPEKRFLHYPNLLKIVGSDFLEARVRKLHGAAGRGSRGIHLFGHTHFEWDHTIEGIRYVQAPLGYPRERQRYTGGGSLPVLLYDSEGGGIQKSSHNCYWSTYYKNNARTPENVTLASWVEGRYDRIAA